MSPSQFWLYMLTIVLAPLIAVQVTEFVNRRRQALERRMWIFRTLMSTRQNRLSIEHVQALNSIDIEFKGRRSQSVVSAWKAYENHLNTAASPDVWLARGNDLFFDLLYEMARSLGYSMDKTDIRSTGYSPMAYGKLNLDQQQLRQYLLEVLEGKRAIPITQPPAED